jgi:hypothetical protein
MKRIVQSALFADFMLSEQRSAGNPKRMMAGARRASRSRTRINSTAESQTKSMTRGRGRCAQAVSAGFGCGREVPLRQIAAPALKPESLPHACGRRDTKSPPSTLAHPTTVNLPGRIYRRISFYFQWLIN